ncbi:MAG: O-antigen ligase family protein [Clostridia bacterium]|nr:O-antigen ligase family protein [Clostridia bacterium]
MEAIKKPDFAAVLTLFALALSGTFHEYLSCAAGAVLAVWLLVQTARGRSFKLPVGLTGISLLCMCVFYFLSALWAVDGGMALIGGFKFLPVLLYALMLVRRGECETLILALPYASAAITLVSGAGMFIPFTSPLFTVNGRLGGSFQYPNAFAMLLLLSIIVSISRNKHGVLDLCVLASLFAGLFLTGSRAVFVLAFICVVIMLFVTKDKKIKIGVPALGAAAALAILAYVLISGDKSIIERITSISFGESTFVGRLLYWRDALPVVAKHPFGTGYLGYYYLQQTIQTGFYSVRYAHNDILQLALDIGWAPCLLFAAAFVKRIFCKKTETYKKIALGAALLHIAFDFDLQFIGYFFVLLLFLDPCAEKTRTVNCAKAPRVAAASACAALCLYFGVACGLERFGANAAALKMHPGNTQARVDLLVEEKDPGRMDAIAQEILKRNEYVSAAYSARARCAFSQGEIKQMIDFKHKVFEIAPYAYDEYEEYCRMLIHARTLYLQAGDANSAAYCLKEMVYARGLLAKLDERTSALGKQIKDQVQTVLPAEITQYIERAEAGNG